MEKNIEYYHNQLLAIFKAHARVGGQGLAIRALIEEIHDQGYALGQRHAEGIFDEVADREQRLVSDLERQIEGTFG